MNGMHCQNNNLGKSFAENVDTSSDTLNVCGVVKGSKVAEAFDACDNFFVNESAFLKESAALNDSVTDS